MSISIFYLSIYIAYISNALIFLRKKKNSNFNKNFIFHQIYIEYICGYEKHIYVEITKKYDIHLQPLIGYFNFRYMYNPKDSL